MTITFRVVSGTLPVTVAIQPSVPGVNAIYVTDNLDHSFTGLPLAEYSLTFLGDDECFYEYEVENDCITTTSTSSSTSTTSSTTSTTSTSSSTTTTTTTEGLPTSYYLYYCGDSYITYQAGGPSYPFINRIDFPTAIGHIYFAYNSSSWPDRFIVKDQLTIVFDSEWIGSSLYDYGGAFRALFIAGLTYDPIYNMPYPDMLHFPDDGYPRVNLPSSGVFEYDKYSSYDHLFVYVYSSSQKNWWFVMRCPTEIVDPTTTTTSSSTTSTTSTTSSTSSTTTTTTTCLDCTTTTTTSSTSTTTTTTTCLDCTTTTTTTLSGIACFENLAIEIYYPAYDGRHVCNNAEYNVLLNEGVPGLFVNLSEQINTLLGGCGSANMNNAAYLDPQLLLEPIYADYPLTDPNLNDDYGPFIQPVGNCIKNESGKWFDTNDHRIVNDPRALLCCGSSEQGRNGSRYWRWIIDHDLALTLVNPENIIKISVDWIGKYAAEHCDASYLRLSRYINGTYEPIRWVDEAHTIEKIWQVSAGESNPLWYPQCFNPVVVPKLIVEVNACTGEDIVPTTTTTSSSTTSTSTSTTTTTTTICTRPLGHIDGKLIYSCYNGSDPTWTFGNTTWEEACLAWNYFHDGIGPGQANAFNIEYTTLTEGATIYRNWGGTTCTCNIPDGVYWFQPDATASLTYFRNPALTNINIVTVEDCVIIAINSCLHVTTTTTSSSSTTTTSSTSTSSTTSTSSSTTTTTTTIPNDCIVFDGYNSTANTKQLIGQGKSPLFYILGNSTITLPSLQSYFGGSYSGGKNVYFTNSYGATTWLSGDFEFTFTIGGISYGPYIYTFNSTTVGGVDIPIGQFNTNSPTITSTFSVQVSFIDKNGSDLTSLLSTFTNGDKVYFTNCGIPPTTTTTTTIPPQPTLEWKTTIWICGSIVGFCDMSYYPFTLPTGPPSLFAQMFVPDKLWSDIEYVEVMSIISAPVGLEIKYNGIVVAPGLKMYPTSVNTWQYPLTITRSAMNCDYMSQKWSVRIKAYGYPVSTEAEFTQGWRTDCCPSCP